MASCQTPQWVNTSPYIRLSITHTSITETQTTLSYYLDYCASSPAHTSVAKKFTLSIGSWSTTITKDINNITGTYNITSGTRVIDHTKSEQNIACSCSAEFNLTWSGVYRGTQRASMTITIDAKTKYSIWFDADGGTGAPSTQTKWHDEAITLSSTKPTRTGYTFQGWETFDSVKYQPGASFTGNYDLTLYAIWKPNTYTVTYNANGGTGVPAAQTKNYGQALTLTTSTPTRTDYTFMGWATTATGAVAYQPGGSYTNNAAITLYAVWKLSYVPPKIYDVTVYWTGHAAQTNANGVECKHIGTGFHWATTNADPNISFSIYDSSGELLNSFSWVATGNSDNDLWETRQWEDYLFPIDKTYTCQLTVYDGAGSTTVTRTLAGEVYAIDVFADGKGIAFGKAAETENIADFAYMAKFTGGIQNIVLLKNNDLNEVTTPNTYVSKNQGAVSYANCPIASGTFVLEVMSAGAEGQVLQRLTSTFKQGLHETYIRHYYQGSWGYWILIYGDTGWFDLELPSGISVGGEMGYLQGRVKNGVLYIRGDVRGISANWKMIANIPSAQMEYINNHYSGRLAASNRFAGIYSVSYACSLNLQSSGCIYTTISPTGSWDSTKDVSINVAIAL